MKKFYIILLICLIPANLLFAQNGKADMSALNSKYPPTHGSKSMNLSAECKSYVNNPGADLQWRAIVNPVAIMHEAEYNEEVMRLKAERLRIKMAMPQEKSASSENSGNATIPQIGASFAGNQSNGSSPLDNFIAISNGGIIVSVSNTTIFYTDASGSNLYYNDLISFIGDSQITGVCDPVVIYDAGADRFVFFCQVSPLNSATSKLLIFFSKTNDPRGGWYYYKVSGNPLNDACAFDYPKIAYSNNEIYITGNLFRDSDKHFSQAVIYQFTKGPAYGGGSLNYTVWYNIDGSPFTICPLSLGQQGSYGPGCYLVATSSSDASTFNFYDLTNDLATGLAQLNHYTINTTAYKVAPDAAQPNTTVMLNTNDARTLGGFYQNNIAHFVFNSLNPTNACGVNYNRFDLGSSTNTSVVFYSSTADYCYPAVASSGVTGTDQSVLIGFQKVSSSVYPSVRVVECDNTMNFSSSVEVKAGDGYVYYTGDPERMGDYSGIYKKYNDSRPTCWMSGAFGGSDNRWNTWIAQVYDNTNGIAAIQDQTAVSVYPNPVVDIFSLEFSLTDAALLTVKIMDANGKLVKNLYEGKGYSGKNVLSFNKANLKPGIYFIVLISNNSVLKNEKIIIAG
jgi:Secretion system C-terminal sorting domain